MKNRPVSVNVTLIFMLLNALIWLAFGVIVAANLHPALHVPPLIKMIIAILAFGASGALLGAFFLLQKRSRIVYFLTLTLLSAISLLTFFDQVGLVDLAVLGVNIIPIILLVKDRKWHLQQTQPV
jgi:hypothetical protein